MIVGSIDGFYNHTATVDDSQSRPAANGAHAGPSSATANQKDFMTLQWRDALSVGNDVIDSDHKYLIDIVNLVERSMGTGDRGQLSDALESLRRYAAAHFVREEKIAAAVGYSAVANLHQSHAALIERLAELKQEIGERWTAQAVDHFGALLRAWLIDHVIKEDLLMKPALQKHPRNFDPR